MGEKSQKKNRKLEEVAPGAFVARESLDSILDRAPRTFSVSQDSSRRIRVVFRG
jgi:hypothetical protein